MIGIETLWLLGSGLSLLGVGGIGCCFSDQQQQQQITVADNKEPEPKRICPDCGMQNPTEANHCGDCGFSFKSTGEKENE